MAIANFQEHHGYSPWENGANAWEKLIADGAMMPLLKDEKDPPAKIGGVIKLQRIDDAYWLVLSAKDDTPLLTPQQALLVNKTLDNGDPNSGNVRSSGERCVVDGQYNLSVHEKVCTLRIKC